MAASRERARIGDCGFGFDVAHIIIIIIIRYRHSGRPLSCATHRR